MTINTVVILVAIAVVSGCKSSVEDRLISKINQECGNQTKPGCEIALKDVTPFEWDKLYFFGAWTTPDSIAKIIGFAYEGDAVPNDYRRIL